jgi:glycosyltransferase involved in cell wall biosynthesis
MAPPATSSAREPRARSVVRAPLRILYVQPSEFFGGEESQLATATPELVAQGLDVLPLVGPGTALVQWLRECGIRDVELCADFPGSWGPARGLGRLTVLERYRRARAGVAAAISRILREREIDLVYASMPFGWAAATAVARKRGVPIVWRAGGPVWLSGRVLGSLVIGPWATLHPPDLLICSSEMVRRSFTGLVPAPRVTVINGVDTRRFRPGAADPRGLRPAEADVVVGFAGRLVARKGIETLLDVAGRMVRTRPGVRFLIAGDGDRRSVYEARARAVGAAGTTRFLGYVADMRAFYAACDVLVLPSHSEGSSMVVLEAMAMGCALAVSDIPSLRELVEPDQHAVVVPPGDTWALERALDGLAADPAWRAALAKAALARVRERFDASRAAARIAELLAGVVDRARGRTPSAALRAAPRG